MSRRTVPSPHPFTPPQTPPTLQATPHPHQHSTPLPTLTLPPPLTHPPIPIRPPHPPILPLPPVAHKNLPLPNLDPALTLLQRLLARPPRRPPMRRRQRDQNALLADRHRAQPVHHRDGRQLVFRVDGARDG